MDLEEYYKNLLIQNIHAKKTPRYLYKYRAINLLSLTNLNDHSLWFSKIESFNDPYEGFVYCDDSVELPISSNLSVERIDKSLQEQEVRLFKIIQGPFVVCCFSRTNKDILLWSHYANWHTGMCLKFDLTKDTDLFYSVFKMTYKNKEIESTSFQMKTDVFVSHLFQRKYKKWAYEREYRVLKYGEDRVYRYNPEALVEVTFGCRTKIEDIRVVQSVVGDSVNYSQCQMNKKKFELKTERILIER